MITGAARALWRSMEEHPWRWTTALLVPLIFLPAIDLGVSAWFFDPATRSFPARTQPVYEWVRRAMPYFMFAAAAYVVVLWLAGRVLGQIFLGVTGRITAYLLGALALGPGLVVNLILKDHWGRPRPSTIQQFGGPFYFSPPLVISGQCDENCSFSSGHGALGFWPLAFALLAPPKARPWAVAAALAFGSAVGFVRIAQGGHFLSDVIFSAVVVISITLWLNHRLLHGDKNRVKNRVTEK